MSNKEQIKNMSLKISKKKFYVDVLPLILILCFIIIDSFNGYLQEYLNLHTPIGVFSRGLIMIVIFPFLFKNKNWVLAKLFLCLLLVYTFAIPLWYLRGQGLSVSNELNNLFKFIYFFAVISYFYSYRYCFCVNTLIKLVVLSALIISVMNILCNVLGIGIKSYGEDFGFGTKAFYADGNSLGLYMILANCLSVWYAFYSSPKFILVAIVISIGTMLIGSRAALLGTIVSWMGILIYIVFCKDDLIRFSKSVKLFICIGIGGGVGYGLYLLYGFISQFDSYTLGRFSVEAATAPRENLILSGKQVIAEFTIGEFIIGKGHSGGVAAVGELYGALAESKSIEADFHDTILTFGWFLGTLMILLQFFIFKKLLFPFFKRRSSLAFTLFLIGCLWMGASYMAGHGFNNTMLAPLLGVYYVISDKLLTSDDTTIN